MSRLAGYAAGLALAALLLCAWLTVATLWLPVRIYQAERRE